MRWRGSSGCSSRMRIDHGDVYVAGDGDGVAVWFPPGPMPDIPDYDERLAAACGPYTARFVELDEQMHKAHPTDPDHAYLAFLTVEAPARNRGIGSALLEAHHRRLDADGTPAYLDASGLPEPRALPSARLCRSRRAVRPGRRDRVLSDVARVPVRHRVRRRRPWAPWCPRPPSLIAAGSVTRSGRVKR